MKRMWSKNELKEVVKSTEKDITTLVDAEGHERFIEGDIVGDTITGITWNYGKWSLSGSHLLIVLAGSVVAGEQLYGKFADINLPNWILDKIIALSGNVIDSKAVPLFNQYLSQSGSITTFLEKSIDKLVINYSSFNPTDERIFRINFDILIDND